MQTAKNEIALANCPKRLSPLLSLLLCFLLILTFADKGLAAHGISIDGQVKYPANFKKFLFSFYRLAGHSWFGG